MKVWCVFDQTPDGEVLQGIYATQEAAGAFMAKLEKRDRLWMVAEEWEVEK